MDKETNNILELKAYMETNPTLEHRSGAVDFFMLMLNIRTVHWEIILFKMSR